MSKIAYVDPLGAAKELIRQATQEYNKKYPGGVLQVYVSPTEKKTDLPVKYALIVHAVHPSIEFNDLRPWFKVEFDLIRRLFEQGVATDFNYVFRQKGRGGYRRKSPYERGIARTMTALLPEVG